MFIMILYDFHVTFLLLVFAFAEENIANQNVNLKCVVDDGFFFKFSLMRGIDAYSLFEYNNESRFRNVSNIASKSCYIEDNNVACKVLTYLEVHKIKIGDKTYQKSFSIFGRNNKTYYTMKYITNITFMFDSCHLASCEGAVPVAYITPEPSAEENGIFSLQYEINSHSIYNVVPFIKIHELRSNKTKELSPFLNGSYSVDDVCGYYNVCIVSKWQACFKNKKIQLTASDCRNISFDQSIDIPGLKFHCNLDRKTKKLFLHSNPHDYQSIYGVYLNERLVQTYETYSSMGTIFLPQVTDPVKLRVNLTICDKCTCHQNVAMNLCSVRRSSTNKDKTLAVVFVAVGVLLLVGILCGLLVFYKIKVKKNATEEQESDVEVTNPRNFHSYHDIEIPPAPYDKLCSVDRSLVASYF